jgi:hypothetical protein
MVLETRMRMLVAVEVRVALVKLAEMEMVAVAELV